MAKTGAMQIGEAVAVEPLLDAGDALIVDIDVADEMRDLGGVRIDAAVLAQEADAGQAEIVDVLLLLRRDLALQPDEALLRRQPFARLGVVEIGQRAGQKLDRLVDVDDAARLAEQRRRLDVGRENQPVAVEDVGRAVAIASWPLRRCTLWLSLVTANITSRAAMTQ